VNTGSGMVKGFSGDVLRSNGTHDFKRTVVLVSIDGLRCISHIYLSNVQSQELMRHTERTIWTVV
jgi:hypothetical protein